MAPIYRMRSWHSALQIWARRHNRRFSPIEPWSAAARRPTSANISSASSPLSILRPCGRHWKTHNTRHLAGFSGPGQGFTGQKLVEGRPGVMDFRRKVRTQEFLERSEQRRPKNLVVFGLYTIASVVQAHVTQGWK